MNEQPRKDAVRNAATVVLVRRDGDAPRVLMGQRGKKAVFMPSKFVFPGGAIDPQDHIMAPFAQLTDAALSKLAVRSDEGIGPALAMAAIRELWEEAGLAIASAEGAAPNDPPTEWESFYGAGHRPDAGALEFFFRAITPPGRPRRFDARFFLADAASVDGDPDDFSGASEELSHLSWLTITEARGLDLPTITEVVLAEVEARLKVPGLDRPIPFFYHQDGISHIEQI